MSIVAGQHLDSFLARRPSQRLRDAVGSRLVELFYFQVLILQTLHSDPHWGNYLFAEDGTIGLVDFGCVKEGPDLVRRLRKSFLYAGRTDSQEFQRIIQDQFAVSGKTLGPATRRAITAFTGSFYRKVYPPDPQKATRPFDFSDPAFLRTDLSAARGLLRARGIAHHYIFLARAEMGLYSTLHRLKARMHTSAIVKRLLTESRTTI